MDHTGWIYYVKNGDQTVWRIRRNETSGTFVDERFAGMSGVFFGDGDTGAFDRLASPLRRPTAVRLGAGWPDDPDSYLYIEDATRVVRIHSGTGVLTEVFRLVTQLSTTDLDLFAVRSSDTAIISSVPAQNRIFETVWAPGSTTTTATIVGTGAASPTVPGLLATNTTVSDVRGVAPRLGSAGDVLFMDSNNLFRVDSTSNIVHLLLNGSNAGLGSVGMMEMDSTAGFMALGATGIAGQARVIDVRREPVQLLPAVSVVSSLPASAGFDIASFQTPALNATVDDARDALHLVLLSLAESRVVVCALEELPSLAPTDSPTPQPTQSPTKSSAPTRSPTLSPSNSSVIVVVGNDADVSPVVIGVSVGVAGFFAALAAAAIIFVRRGNKLSTKNVMRALSITGAMRVARPVVSPTAGAGPGGRARDDEDDNDGDGASASVPMAFAIPALDVPEQEAKAMLAPGTGSNRNVRQGRRTERPGLAGQIDEDEEDDGHFEYSL